MNLYTKVLESMATNEKLTTLLALLIQSFDDEIAFPADKLIGDWESAAPGQKVHVTYTDPFRVEEGFLFTLPGLKADDTLRGGIIQFPAMSDDEDKQTWQLLKHVAIFAETIELEPRL